MSDIRSKISNLYSLEQLAQGNTFIHRLHPVAKIIVTLCYLVCVLSMDRYQVSALMPFVLYPVIMMSLLDIPYGIFLGRACIALPFVLCAGISNLFFDHTGLRVLGLVIPGGVVTLAALLIRTLLSVTAVLILVAATPFSKLTRGMRQLHVPAIFVALTEMVYRYITVLASEGEAMLYAYRLRSGGRKWPTPREFGPFVGQLFLRSAARAQRVYQAMQCRLYGEGEDTGCNRQSDVIQTNGELSSAKANINIIISNVTFMLVGCGSSTIFRLVDISQLLGELFV